MNSIRRHLWIRLAAGMGVVWILAGAAIHQTVLHRLRSAFDRELDSLVSEVKCLLPAVPQADSSARGLQRTVDFFVANSGYYFQIWDPDGLFSDRSPSLGGSELPVPGTIGAIPVYWDCSLSSGEHVRAGAVRVSIPLSGPGPSSTGPAGAEIKPAMEVDIVVARNREELDRALSLVVFGTAGVWVVTALVAAVVVSLALRKGLRPLDRLGKEAGAIDTQSLAFRFPVGELPVELRPIGRGLNELMQRLEAGFERERRFSADLAHELRTPVTELKTMAECALRWPDDADKADFREVLEIADRMHSLLETLLAMAKPARGASVAKSDTVQLAETVVRCWRPHVNAAAGKSIRFESVVPKTLTLNTNAEHLHIILGNLLSNAAAHTPPSGVVRVQADSMPGGGVELTIENSVTGVQPDDVDHFFDRFWRADTSRTGSVHHGLGLSLALLSAEAMGYRLIAELSASGDTIRLRLVT